MKSILFLLSGLFIIMSCSKTMTNDANVKLLMNDLAIEHLKGDISSYKETPYKTDSTGKIGEMDTCCTSVFDFNIHGFMVRRAIKDSKGLTSDELIFKHFDNGLWKGASTTKYGKSTGYEEAIVDHDGKYRTVVEYDSAGNKISYYTDITRNNDGQTLTWKLYDMDSVLRMSEESEFDKNLKTKTIAKNGSGKIIYSTTYKYNDKGELAEVLNTSISKAITTAMITRYTYEAHDKLGNWIQRTTWNDKGKATGISRRNYTYRKKE